jgi:hypothetical protein
MICFIGLGCKHKWLHFIQQLTWVTVHIEALAKYNTLNNTLSI